MLTLPLAKLSTAAGAINNLALVTPQQNQGYLPQVGDGKTIPPSILFSYEGQQRVILESDITEHYVEDNSTRSSNIALKSPRITVKGYIGEIETSLPASLQFLSTIADKLTTLGILVPGLSVQAQKVYQDALFAYQVGEQIFNAGVNAWNTISNVTQTQAVVGNEGIAGFDSNTGRVKDLNVQNRQQLAFIQFYGYWQNKTLFTVQTPWAVFQNMAISKVEPFQDADTLDRTEFSVEFKMIRTVSTRREKNQRQGRLNEQGAPLINNGNSPLVPEEKLSATTINRLGFNPDIPSSQFLDS
jgi:hypothetical protein